MIRKLIYVLAALGALWLFFGFSVFVERVGADMFERAAYLDFQGRCTVEGALCVCRSGDCAP